MRKEIAPELYNYNKFPGPEFQVNGDKVETEGIAFTLVENIKDAFDVTVFNQRFSEVLTKFDYVVGDWSNEQLRLRGFYKDDRTEEKIEKISRLQDYLLEYCSYSCAYFVLENQEPKRASFDKKSRKKEEENLPRRGKKPSQNKRKPNADKRNRRRHKDQKSQKEDKGQRHFVIRQK